MSKLFQFAAIFAIALFLFQASGSCLAAEVPVSDVAGCECSDARILDIGSDASGCQMDCQCPCNISLSFANKTDFIQPGEIGFQLVLTVPANLNMVSTSVFQPPKPSL